MKKLTSTFALLLLLTTSFWACTENRDAVEAAEKEVFSIHDEIMPLVMGDLVKLQKQLNQRVTTLDSATTNGSAVTTVRTDEEKQQAIQLSHNLTLADSLMNHWMNQYNGDTLSKLSSDQALYYLTTQKDQISDVKSKVNSSINQARQFLGKQ